MRFAHTAFVLLASALPSLSFAAPCAGFTDVDDSSGFCANVEWMKNRGITLGLTSTQYGPDSYVTRLQMAAFMYRLGFQNAFLQGGSAFGTTAVIGTTDGQPVEVHVDGARALRIEPGKLGGPNVIAGAAGNAVAPDTFAVTIAGGGYPYEFCNGPCTNFASESFATVSGGIGNQATGRGSFVAGGDANTAEGGRSAVLGGQLNAATGIASVTVGGTNNTAASSYSFAAGNHAKANHSGCFVWSGGSNSQPTSCFAENEFVARASGGFYFWTAGFDDNSYSGARLATGTGAWAQYSDRNGKQAINPVDASAVLEKLIAMPIATWQWKAEPGNVVHMGPMAQDFRSAFGLGDSDKQIVTVDADGVALAAIQGLNAKHEAERAAKDAEIAALRAELAGIRSLLVTIAAPSTRTAEIAP